MSLDAQAAMDLADKSFESQRNANEKVLTSALDAGDRMLMRKAADSIVNLTQVMALTDPTK